MDSLNIFFKPSENIEFYSVRMFKIIFIVDTCARRVLHTVASLNEKKTKPNAVYLTRINKYDTVTCDDDNSVNFKHHTIYIAYCSIHQIPYTKHFITMSNKRGFINFDSI